MSDVVVTVPLSFGLDTWIDEGDAAGETWSGEEWDFYLGGTRPNIKRGERVYVVYNGAIRGYAPLVRIDTDPDERWRFSLVRHGGAVAVTIPQYVQGFRGWRYRWWDTAVEVPFPDWQDPWACIGFTRPERKPAPSKRPTTPHVPVPVVRCGNAIRCQHANMQPSTFDVRFLVCPDCGHKEAHHA